MTEKKHNNYDVLVVGGGAAGLMSAGRAAERGKRVLLLEKNKRLGEKLRITGGGRCNVTNAEEDEHMLLKNYGKAEQFLYSSFSRFGMNETFSSFEQLGLPLIVEAKKRAFPETQKAADVVKALERYIKNGKVAVVNNSKVTRILSSNNRISGVITGGVTYTADSYVLATGGISHPETGSTGEGFVWLKELGHTIKDPTPTIVPIRIKESWVHKFSGTTMNSVKITFFESGKKAFSKTGDILFTHFGVSGPLILNSAKDVADLLQAGEVTATIDCFPKTDLGALEAQILKVFDENKNKMFKNVFKQIALPGTGEVLLAFLAEISPEKNVHSITKAERKHIARLLKELPLTVKGLMGTDRAVVADGGVPLEELDMKTMRSKFYKNLFITGDLLHINRPSGGYSLQLCWTSGFVAGDNA